MRVPRVQCSDWITISTFEALESPTLFRMVVYALCDNPLPERPAHKIGSPEPPTNMTLGIDKRLRETLADLQAHSERQVDFRAAAAGLSPWEDVRPVHALQWAHLPPADAMRGTVPLRWRDLNVDHSAIPS